MKYTRFHWVLLAVLLSIALACAARATPVDRFERQIRAFERADGKQLPPPGATVFVGSSTFVKWTTLEQDFASIGAINRGFGGSTIAEATHYADRIVIKYRPSKVVLYAGTNDIAEGKTGEHVFHDFVAFAARVTGALPGVDLYFISMSMAPSRERFAAQYDSGNSLIRGYCAQHAPHLHYIDVTTVMRDAKGKVRGDLFGPDRLHMNADGYALWLKVLRPAIR